MQRFLDRLLPPAKPRRMTGIQALQLKTLNTFIWVTGIGCLLMRIVLLLLGDPGRPGLYVGIAIFLIGLLVLLVLERYVPYPVVSFIFTLLITTGLVFSDNELPLIQGESLFFFILPIAVAALLVRPWAGYVMAGLVSAGVSFEIIRLHLGIPNIPVFFLFFLVALTIHQSTYRLYQAVEQDQKKSSELLESEAKYHRLIDLLPVGVLIHQDGKIALANPACLKFVGAKKPEDLIGTPLIDRVHPDDRAFVQRRARAAFVEGKTAEPMEERFLRLDGSVFHAESSGTPFTFNGKPAILVVINDVNERKKFNETITAKNRHIQEMARKLLEVQERERRILASELHDDLGQLLTSLKLKLELSGRARSPSTRKERMGEARELVTEVMQKVRNLSLELRPAVLDDFGLFPALRWLFDRFESQTGIFIKCNYDSDSQLRLEPHVETAAFRIVQEALTNVARHASVSEAEVVVSVNGNLTVEVADQGAGFEVERILQDTDRSAGLAGMQERARLLGGTLEIVSGPGAGTRVIAQIPLTGSIL